MNLISKLVKKIQAVLIFSHWLMTQLKAKRIFKMDKLFRQIEPKTLWRLTIVKWQHKRQTELEQMSMHLNRFNRNQSLHWNKIQILSSSLSLKPTKLLELITSKVDALQILQIKYNLKIWRKFHLGKVWTSNIIKHQTIFCSSFRNFHHAMINLVFLETLKEMGTLQSSLTLKLIQVNLMVNIINKTQKKISKFLKLLMLVYLELKKMFKKKMLKEKYLSTVIMLKVSWKWRKAVKTNNHFFEYFKN